MEGLEKQILEKAKILIKRYGNDAVESARKEAEKAPMGAFPSDKDIAMRVLTKVEELVSLQTN